MRIAVIGDSISSRNNGCAAHSWPELLDSMVKSLGVFGIEVRNYSIPGLTWRTAKYPTVGWLIGGNCSPLTAAMQDGFDLLIVCLGVNDRHNPEALSDAMVFAYELPDNTVWVRQKMFDPVGINDAVVTEEEQARMYSVYDRIGGNGFHLNLGKLYDLGYSYDMLHPTNSGKQWIASAVYMYLQQSMPLTPIVRNIAWLHSQPEVVREQMRVANT